MSLSEPSGVAFDIGVFLVVVSVVTSFLLGLSSRDQVDKEKSA